MNNDDRIREEVEKTLHAFDNDRHLEPNPFLFTRMQAEREQRLRGGKRRGVGGIGLRWIVILCVILINLITVAHYAQWRSIHTRQQTLASELEKDFPVDDASGEN